MAGRPAQLTQAFARTKYIVVGLSCVAEIGRRARALEALLARSGAHHGIFVTGWNPSGRHQARGANLAANAALRQRLLASGLRPRRALNAARDPHWSEESFFVPGMKEAAAMDLGRRFGQVAIVVVERGRLVRLRFID